MTTCTLRKHPCVYASVRMDTPVSAHVMWTALYSNINMSCEQQDYRTQATTAWSLIKYVLLHVRKKEANRPIVFPYFPGQKIKHILIAYCFSNRSAENYQNYGELKLQDNKTKVWPFSRQCSITHNYNSKFIVKSLVRKGCGTTVEIVSLLLTRCILK